MFLSDGYAVPVGPGYNLTLGFGVYYRLLNAYPAIHPGWDWAKEPGGGYGLPIYAAANGIVTFAQDVVGQSWRKLVVIQHADPDGVTRCSRYGHLARIDVQAGQWVTRGQVIGLEGDAEGLFYPHLHWDLGKGDLLVRDPTNWPGDNRAYVLTYYDDPTEVYRTRMATNDPIAQARNLLSQADTLLASLQGTPPETPVTLYCTAQPSLNVRDQPSTAGGIVGFLNYGESVSVVSAPTTGWKRIVSGRMHLDKNNLALQADAAGRYASAAYLDAARPT